MISDNQLRALNIIKDNLKIKAVDFAKLMWPDSEMLKQHWLKVNRYGLAYLFKLVKRNWVTEHNYKFELTKEGIKELQDGMDK